MDVTSFSSELDGLHYKSVLEGQCQYSVPLSTTLAFHTDQNSNRTAFFNHHHPFYHLFALLSVPYANHFLAIGRNDPSLYKFEVIKQGRQPRWHQPVTSVVRKPPPDNEITKSGLGVVGTLLQDQSAGEKSQADWA